jgi:hypothetical protein
MFKPPFLPELESDISVNCSTATRREPEIPRVFVKYRLSPAAQIRLDVDRKSRRFRRITFGASRVTFPLSVPDSCPNMN